MAYEFYFKFNSTNIRCIIEVESGGSSAVHQFITTPSAHSIACFRHARPQPPHRPTPILQQPRVRGVSHKFYFKITNTSLIMSYSRGLKEDSTEKHELQDA